MNKNIMANTDKKEIKNDNFTNPDIISREKIVQDMTNINRQSGQIEGNDNLEEKDIEQYKIHNSVYFLDLQYDGINRKDIFVQPIRYGTFMIMPVGDSELNFGIILEQINKGKQLLVDTINSGVPNINVTIEDIKILNINKIIGEIL